MNPCGRIDTIMDLRLVKEWWFNIPLLVFQFVFIVMATVYGKIQWDARRPSFVDYTIVPVCIFGIVAFVAGATGGKIGGIITFILLFLVSVILFVILVATYREMPLRKVWQAAKVSHVRLVLEKADQTAEVDVEWGNAHRETIISTEEIWLTANFGYPKMKIQPWYESWNKGNHRYYDPTFEPSDEFIAATIEYAEGEVGKRYDWLQLILGYPVNFVLWLFWPPWWGKEKIRWFNLPGGKEVCSSGWVADLRWGERDFWDEYTRDVGKTFGVKSLKDNRRFFPGYDTAVIPPSLAALSKNWRERES